MQASLASLIGIPYDDQDCWGIVRLYHKTFNNLDLPKYFYANACDTDEIEPIIFENKVNYRRVGKPQRGDIILIRIFGSAAHLGIYLDEKCFLHTQKGTGSIIDSLQKYQKRILGFYRYD